MASGRQLPIERAYLAQYFKPATLSRGEAYFAENRVLPETLELKMPSAEAYVQGSKRHPYHVEVEFAKRKGGWKISKSYCSCPVFFNCKHSVAMLLMAGEISSLANI